MTSSAQLERESERARTELTRTLDELRERITPGQLLDQAVDYAKDSSGGDFVRNLTQQITAKPLAVTLVGAGLAWLMVGRASPGAASSQTARNLTSTTHAVTGRAEQATPGDSEQGFDLARAANEAASETGRRAAEMADSTGQSLREFASSPVATASNTAADAYGKLADTARDASSTVANSAAGVSQKAASATRDALQFCKGQPLILAGLGLALGAIVGTLIPVTETEDDLMGETSDRLKDQAREAAENQVERVQDEAEQAQSAVAGQSMHPSSEGSSGSPERTESHHATLVPDEHNPALEKHSAE